MITSQEKILQERLEKILPDWTITDNLKAKSKIRITYILESQLNQIAKLGLFVCGIVLGNNALTVSFSELNK